MTPRHGVRAGLSAILTLLALLLPALITPSARAQFGQEQVEVTSLASRTDLRPGDQVVLAVILDHQYGWHSHTNDPRPPKEWGLAAIPTVIKPRPTPGLRFGPVQWPEAHEVLVDLGGTGVPVPYEVFEGRAIAYIPVIVEDSAKAGELPVQIDVTYQACNDKTCAFQKDVVQTVALKIAPAGAERDPEAGPDVDTFGAFRTQVFSDMLKGVVVNPAASADLVFNFFGSSVTLKASNPFFFTLFLLAAALGGLVLNLTPCVIPVIPIKIMSLSAAAGNPRRCFYLGIITSLGIIFFWLVIGGAVAFISGFTQVNQLFQYPLFTIGVGAFIAIMALGMLGLFTINLPGWVYKFMPRQGPRSAGGASGGSTSGTFVFGIFTAILATPCLAPFMGAATAWGATQPPSTTLATFLAIGAGMALPYAILSAFPKWVSKVPRSGPASELVKQVMGLLMLAVAVFFLGTGIDPLMRLPIDPPIRWFWWLVAFFTVAAMGLLIFRTYTITPSPARRAFWTIAGLVLAAAGVYTAVHFTDRGPIPWVSYTPERLEEARRQNMVIVMDFTAEWCLNCKALEHGVLHRPEIVSLLTAPDVVPMRVDLTGNNVPGQDMLKSLQWLGIPLLAISGPGHPDPLKYDSYAPSTVTQAISQARGTAAAAVPPTAGAVTGRAADSTIPIPSPSGANTSSR